MKPPAEAVAAVRALAERRLSAAEFAAYIDAPITDGERQAVLDLVAWFTRRYPTPAERLRVARRAWADAAALMP